MPTLTKVSKSVKKTFRMLWSSDHHNLHDNTPTAHILSNLGDFLFRKFDLEETDFIVFGGDFFHQIVESSNLEMRRCEYWILDFLEKCKKHNVIVRVLEGTSSHDWRQPEMFELLKPTGLDLKWVRTLSIEYIEKLGINVLYVPDNMGDKKPDVIWNETIELLSSKGLKQVDFVFFHGAFKYQIDERFSEHSHDERQWKTIAKFGIFAGHVHKPSQNGNIYVSGSFDRIAHGEEHPKGGYVVDFNPETDYFKATFYENKKALPFVTLKVGVESTTSEITDRLNDLIEKHKFPLFSQIRIKGGLPEVVNPIIGFFKTNYPQFIFKAENASSPDQLVEDRLYTEQTYVGVTLTKENITESLIEFLNDAGRIGEDDHGRIRTLIKEFIK